jgi:hypothetical protein
MRLIIPFKGWKNKKIRRPSPAFACWAVFTTIPARLEQCLASSPTLLLRSPSSAHAPRRMPTMPVQDGDYIVSVPQSYSPSTLYLYVASRVLLDGPL